MRAAVQDRRDAKIVPEMAKQDLRQQRITYEQFRALTRPLLGLTVSRTWRGYGSTIFLEMGELKEVTRRGKDDTTRVSLQGQATIMFEMDWRVERPQSILFGSFASKQKIEHSIKKLEDEKVVDIDVEGRLPEIVIALSGGFWVHSFRTLDGQPEWCLFFNEGGDCLAWIDSYRGGLRQTFDKQP